MAPAANFHATCVIVADRGVLIRGASGSGKTALALQLATFVGSGGGFACIVSDDQLFLAEAGGRLCARAPRSIAGLVEIRGLGIRKISHTPAAVVDLVVSLVPAGVVERHPETHGEVLIGVPVRAVSLPERNSAGSALAVLAALGLPPFR